MLDAPVKDGSFLAPFLLWRLKVSDQFAPLDIGAAFEDPTSAARVHHAPAEASDDKNLGIAMMNIGENTIPCTLQFLTEAGAEETALQLSLDPKASLVRFFNEDLPAEGFIGSITLSCQDPVVAIVVVQDRSNGEFPSDFVTVKGLN